MVTHLDITKTGVKVTGQVDLLFLGSMPMMSPQVLTGAYKTRRQEVDQATLKVILAAGEHIWLIESGILTSVIKTVVMLVAHCLGTAEIWKR